MSSSVNACPMKVLQIDPDSQIHFKDLPKPQIGDDEALIRTLGCGVCGTDLLKINLKLLKKPTILGHEIVGEVCEIGSRVKNFKIGDRVVVAHHVPCLNCHFCRHESYSMCETFKKTNLDPGGFAEYVRLSKAHLEHTTFTVPETLPWREAIFTEPLACCVRNLHRLPMKKGDCVIVIGLGSIGLMMGTLLKRLECKTIGVEIDPERCKIAKEFGFENTFSKYDEGLLKKIKDASENRMADGVILTAGPAKLLQESLSWIRNGGFINLFSHLSGEKSEIDTAELYHRELQIVTSYSSCPKSLKEAFQILTKENLNLRRMFQIYPYEKFSQAIADVNEHRTLKALIEFE